MIALEIEEIAAFLDEYLEVQRFPGDPAGVLRPAAGPVSRLGVALEPDPGLAGWVAEEGLDAVLLHRAWGVEELRLGEGVGVLTYHLALDDRLTLGFSPRLAEACGVTGAEPAPAVNGRVVGMCGAVRPVPFATYRRRLEQVFGGIDTAQPGSGEPVRRVALMGAMTDGLVRWAAERGVDVYVTGQLRGPARGAVEETGIGVVAVGHRRTEEWGVRALAHLLRERWRGMEVRVRETAR